MTPRDKAQARRQERLHPQPSAVASFTEADAETLLRRAASSERHLGFAVWLQRAQQENTVDLGKVVAAARKLVSEPGVRQLLYVFHILSASDDACAPGTRVSILFADDAFNVTTRSGTVLVGDWNDERSATDDLRVETDDGEILFAHRGTVRELDVASLLGELAGS